jgi:hypothetical protein
MERTPEGTPVGVDDPYDIAGVCDHLTDDGRCRLALQHAGVDREFAAERAADDYACHVGEDGNWPECRHYRSTTHERTCERCGLEEVRVAHDERRPLLEEHHLSYADGEGTSHEITVSLCRWCHAKVHQSFARVDDDVEPDPEAIAERETRRAAENQELGFQSARDRSEK